VDIDHDGAGCGVPLPMEVEVIFSGKMAISCILSGDHNIAVACRQRETVQ